MKNTDGKNRQKVESSEAELLEKYLYKKASKVLKQKLIPLNEVRFIIGSIYRNLAIDVALSTSHFVIDSLLSSNLMQPGPQWDIDKALSLIASPFQFEEEVIDKLIDKQIVAGHSLFMQSTGSVIEAEYILFRCYFHLRTLNNLLVSAPSKKEGRILWQKAWELASKEPSVAKELGNPSPKKVSEFKALATERARRAFLDLVRPLKRDNIRTVGKRN